MTHSGDDGSIGRDLLGSQRLHAPTDRDELVGRIKDKKRSPANLSKGLDQRLGLARRAGFKASTHTWNSGGDMRQRVIVKIHFFGHGGGGAAALAAHARYVGRDDAAEREIGEAKDRNDEESVRAHAGYLERDACAGFYDGLTDGVDGAARMAVWAREDKRHFRLIIAAENGAEMKGLKPFVRDVMDEAERALGTRLEWVAIDHFDTSQPHTHVVLRGRRANGRPLVLPKDYVKQGFRDTARTIATQRLGRRSRQDERLALEREARAHRPTRLDQTIAQRVGVNSELRIADLSRRQDAPDYARALKLRARELQRLGLASEVRRNVLSMHSGWRDKLTAMELHLDVRKRIVQQRARTTTLRPTAGLQLGPWRL